MHTDRGVRPWRGAGGAVADVRALGAFFALLFLHAALTVLIQAAIGTGWLPAPRLALWHGHELLFGFASGMMGGYLMGLRNPGRLRVLLAPWLAGRVGILLAMTEGSAFWVGFALFYPFVLVFCAVRPFLKGGLRLRNRMFALPPMLLLLAECLFVWNSLTAGDGVTALLIAATAVIGMMLLVGGRLAMAAINGQRQKRGLVRLSTSWDARLEYALALCLSGWLAAELVGAENIARAAVAILVLLAVLRLLLWRPGPALAARRVRLYLLGLGWVLTGLAWRAVTVPSDLHAMLVVLHPAFVGGLAILAGSVSLQARLQRIVPLAELDAAVEGAAALFSVAALARIVGTVNGSWPWMMVAAFTWTAGALIIISRHLSGPRPAGG